MILINRHFRECCEREGRVWIRKRWGDSSVMMAEELVTGGYLGDLEEGADVYDFILVDPYAMGLLTIVKAPLVVLAFHPPRRRFALDFVQLRNEHTFPFGIEIWRWWSLWGDGRIVRIVRGVK